MSGTVELDPDGKHLQIRFAYRQDLVEDVKTLPQRRWDPAQKVWRVPIAHAEAVYKLLARNLFQFSSEVMSIVAGTLGAPRTAPPPADDGGSPPPDKSPPPRRGRRPDGGQGSAPDAPSALLLAPDECELPDAGFADFVEAAPDLETLTIADLNRQVRELIRGVFPWPLWVTGEVADFDKSAGKASRFFKLIDKQEGSDQRRAEACAVLFADTARVLDARLRQLDEPLTLRDGIEIRARVRVDFWPEGGQYRLVIEDIDPTFTLGKLALDRERILQQLRSKGLERRNLELPLPAPALRIGVLASPESDGWTDLLRHLQESAIGFQVTLVPIRVQGQALRPTLLRGLRWFATHAEDHDLVCIVRGGGSRTDLAWFDDLEVALAVARHPLKILVGIGHQRDRSVLDEIAHSEKTPTAVAAFLTAQVHLARNRITQQCNRLRLCSQALLADQQGQVQELAARLAASTHSRLRLERERLGLTSGRLVRESRRLLRGERDNLRLRAAALQRSVRLNLERASRTLQGHAERLRLLDPRTVLLRGFALVRNSNGRILPDARAITPGQDLAIHLRDGVVHTRAAAVEPRPGAMSNGRKREPNWLEASSELEQILREIESGDIDLDALHQRVERAAELIQLCRDKLGSTELKVRKVVEALAEDGAGASAEE